MNKKCYKQSWFWLMLIFILFLVYVLIKAIYPFVDKITVDGNIVEVIANICTSAALVVTILVFMADKRHKCRCETIKDFPVFRIQNSNLSEKIEDKNKDEQITIICEYLREAERFAVGVNEKLYDIKIINRMSGGLLISQYEKHTRKYINTQRCQNTGKIPSENLFCEYEKMINDLYTLRAKQRRK